MTTTVVFQEEIEIPFFQSLREFRDWATFPRNRTS